MENITADDFVIDVENMPTGRRILDAFNSNGALYSNPRTKSPEITPAAQQNFFEELRELSKSINASHSRYQRHFDELKDNIISSGYGDHQSQHNSRPIRPAPKSRPGRGRAPQPPLRAQKTSNSVPRLNKDKVVRSERSVVKQATQTSGDPLDVWNRVSPFFSPLSSLENLKNAIENALGPMPDSQLPQQRITHWAEPLTTMVNQLQSEGGLYKKLLEPPPPPVAPEEEASYWKNNVVPFPLPAMQRRNRSAMHLLLGALVPSETIQLNSTETDRELYFPTIDILPIGINGYSGEPFEIRLECELKAAGLVEEENDEEKDRFSTEIDRFRKELQVLKPQYEELSRELFNEFPKYLETEKQKEEEKKIYQALFSESSIKKRKKIPKVKAPE